jgi:hypothetical protein
VAVLVSACRADRRVPLENDEDSFCAEDLDADRRSWQIAPFAVEVHEGFTSLLRAVSTGRLSPPEEAVFNAAPIELRVEERHERLDIATRRRFIGGLYVSGLW